MTNDEAREAGRVACKAHNATGYANAVTAFSDTLDARRRDLSAVIDAWTYGWMEVARALRKAE